MHLNRYSLVHKIIVFLLVAVLIVPINVFGAIQETVQPLASYYLESYTAYICPMGGGDLEIWFRVTGTDLWADIGVLTIRLYESTDNSTWTWVDTFRHTNYPEMLDHDDDHHMSHVDYQGVAGRYYKAYVTIWAGDEETGDSRYIWTPVVQAT